MSQIATLTAEATPYVEAVLNGRQREIKRAAAGPVARVGWTFIWPIIMAVAPLIIKALLEWIAQRSAESVTFSDSLRGLSHEVPDDARRAYRLTRHDVGG